MKKCLRALPMPLGLGWKLPLIGPHWPKSLKLVGKPGSSFWEATQSLQPCEAFPATKERPFLLFGPPSHLSFVQTFSHVS